MQECDVSGLETWDGFWGSTHNCWVDECAPAALILEQGQDERYGGGTKQDNDELVLELLEDKLQERCRRLLGDG